MADYDFDVPAPAVPRSRHPDLRKRIEAMPEGASFFVASQHKSNTIATNVSWLRKNKGLNLTCRREERDGVEGFRIWRLKNEEK